MNIILEGITGSKAYGLDHANSDTDIKGIFVAPTDDIAGMFWSDGKETVNQTQPDKTYHEVGKFVKLASKCNPTVLEFLFLEDYLQLNEFGKLLVDNRKLFLSNAVFKSYGGYAIGQANKLNRREAEGKNGFSSDTVNRYAKHARHCFRLLLQGRQLLETGELTVRVTPEQREELFTIGDLPVDKLVDKFTEEFAEFDKIQSVLPDSPDLQKINELLLTIRRAN